MINIAYIIGTTIFGIGFGWLFRHWRRPKRAMLCMLVDGPNQGEFVGVCDNGTVIRLDRGGLNGPFVSESQFR